MPAVFGYLKNLINPYARTKYAEKLSVRSPDRPDLTAAAHQRPAQAKPCLHPTPHPARQIFAGFLTTRLFCRPLALRCRHHFPFSGNIICSTCERISPNRTKTTNTIYPGCNSVLLVAMLVKALVCMLRSVIWSFRMPLKPI
jgi:hypothetical protein